MTSKLCAPKEEGRTYSVGFGSKPLQIFPIKIMVKDIIEHPEADMR